MHLISPTEAIFISRGIHQNIREDGRLRDQLRKFTVETDCLPQANGSARATVHRGSDVLVGIKIDLATPDLNKPTEGKIICSVDCSNSTRIDEYEHKSMREVNAELAEIVHRTINSSFDLKQLCILCGQYCWFLYVDVVVLDYGGNLIDILMLAIHAAIKSTPIPKVLVNRIDIDTDPKATPEFSLEIDETENTFLNVASLPLFITIYVSCLHDCKRIEFFLDANKSEELSSMERIHFATDRTGLIYSIKNIDCSSLGLNDFMAALRLAKGHSCKLFNQLDEHLGKMIK